MATVIPRSELSDRIVRGLFRDELREASGAVGSGAAIEDPRANDRSGAFVLTSRPDRDTLYPILIVEEGGDSGSRPDRRLELHEHAYDVRVTVQATNSTHRMRIKDQLRGWFEANIDLLNTEGFEDPEISVNPATWGSDPRVEELEVTFSGIVNTGEKQ